jgi:hypothetical protein
LRGPVAEELDVDRFGLAHGTIGKPVALRWNGSSWDTLAPITSDTAYPPAAIGALGQSALFAAWDEGVVMVKEYSDADGGSWFGLDGSASGFGAFGQYTESPSVATSGP